MYRIPRLSGAMADRAESARERAGAQQPIEERMSGSSRSELKTHYTTARSGNLTTCTRLFPSRLIDACPARPRSWCAQKSAKARVLGMPTECYSNRTVGHERVVSSSDIQGPPADSYDLFYPLSLSHVQFELRSMNEVPYLTNPREETAGRAQYLGAASAIPGYVQ